MKNHNHSPLQYYLRLFLAILCLSSCDIASHTNTIVSKSVTLQGGTCSLGEHFRIPISASGFAANLVIKEISVKKEGSSINYHTEFGLDRYEKTSLLTCKDSFYCYPVGVPTGSYTVTLTLQERALKHKVVRISCSVYVTEMSLLMRSLTKMDLGGETKESTKSDKKPKFIELAAEVFFNKLSAIEAKIDRELRSNTNSEKVFIDIVKTYKSCSRYYDGRSFLREDVYQLILIDKRINRKLRQLEAKVERYKEEVGKVLREAQDLLNKIESEVNETWNVNDSDLNLKDKENKFKEFEKDVKALNQNESIKKILEPLLAKLKDKLECLRKAKATLGGINERLKTICPHVDKEFSDTALSQLRPTLADLYEIIKGPIMKSYEEDASQTETTKNRMNTFVEVGSVLKSTDDITQDLIKKKLVVVIRNKIQQRIFSQDDPNLQNILQNLNSIGDRLA